MILNIISDIAKKIYWNCIPVFNKKTWNYIVARKYYERKGRKKTSSKKILKNKIAFIVPQLSILYHFLPIIKHLDSKDYILIIVNEDYFEVKKIISFLKKMSLDYTFPYDVLSRNSFYKLVISNSAPIGISPFPPFNYKNKEFLGSVGLCQVRMMYAGGKLKWNLSDWNRIYDHIFVYGPYYAKLFKKRFKAEIHQIGYPRFDRFFSVDKSNHDLISRLSKFKQNKKTIVYLPTHGKLSAFDRFKGMLGKLTQDYNVIVKPHPWLDITNKELNEKGILILDKNLDNIDYFKIADFVFADYGGSVLGAIYANRNLVLLDVTNPLKDSDNMIEESPDYMMRKHILHLENPDQLDYIKEFLSDDNYWKKQEKVRLSLREKYFEFNMESGKTAALKLLDILENS